MKQFNFSFLFFQKVEGVVRQNTSKLKAHGQFTITPDAGATDSSEKIKGDFKLDIPTTRQTAGNGKTKTSCTWYEMELTSNGLSVKNLINCFQPKSSPKFAPENIHPMLDKFACNLYCGLLTGEKRK